MKIGNRKLGNKRINKKVAAGIVFLMVTFTGTMGIAYADVDIAGTLQSWFNKKTDLAVTSLTQSIQSETDTQKAQLKKELQLRLEASAQEIDTFTEEQRTKYIAAIQKHAAELIASMNINNDQDRQQIQAKLQTITDSAMQAMDTLSGSYTPPAVVYTPPVVESTQPAEDTAQQPQETQQPAEDAAQQPQETQQPAKDAAQQPQETQQPADGAAQQPQETPQPAEDAAQ
ncbi:hypothetical protein GZH47_16785 [Paenibacillus rhizovicinus]|uniref:Uncharacterized protein n=1 Tax=Paenibacillus rhizovicinus TaxID=2704463 RepID=A0A6C0P1G5_9BACL|nr:hypothetical protein [Paenibacillus rhizovicinus]QHW32299.1 hypothetical protein GZH47_16785 [Paenibacillus rhizovicinus]